MMRSVDGSLREDLRRVRAMSFRHGDKCGDLVQRFHASRPSINGHLHEGLLAKIYSWLLVPFSLWPIDFCGLSKHVLTLLETKVAFDEELVLLLQTIDSPPDERTRKIVGDFEADVEAGRYDKLIKRPEKFSELENDLNQDTEFTAAWEELKRHHDHKAFQNSKGVIRRRLSQERNLREGWDFDWTEKRKRFFSIFDALCHRWRLYGIEGDKPLLLKISVNPTPHGTMIVIPREWSLDPIRDLNWSAISKIHRAHGAKRQGPKLSPGRVKQREEAQEAKRLWMEARAKGHKGDARFKYVQERMHKANRGDEWLKRLIKLTKQSWGARGVNKRPKPSK